mmetsp:Transcript_11435/g.32815  ORF Transcript_11435/g.32815 Transcript_11435/m.32815 type:complete len:399 (-) Transcript_11435:281-1477(-)
MRACIVHAQSDLCYRHGHLGSRWIFLVLDLHCRGVFLFILGCRFCRDGCCGGRGSSSCLFHIHLHVSAGVVRIFGQHRSALVRSVHGCFRRGRGDADRDVLGYCCGVQHGRRGADLLRALVVGLLAQGLARLFRGPLVANVNPFPSRLVLLQEPAWRIAVPNGTDDNTRDGWLLNLGRANVVGTVQCHDVTESLVPLVMIGESASSAKDVVVGHEDVSILVHGIGGKGFLVRVGTCRHVFMLALCSLLARILHAQRKRDASGVGQIRIALHDAWDDLWHRFRHLDLRDFRAIGDILLADAERLSQRGALSLFGVGTFAKSLRRLFCCASVANVVPLAVIALLEESSSWVAMANCSHNAPRNIRLVHLRGTDVVRAVQRDDVAESPVPDMRVRHSTASK